DDLVTRIDDRAKREVHGFAYAHGNQDLGFGIVRDFEVLLEADGNGCAQPWQSQIRCVAGAAAFQRINRRLANVPRRDEVWFANAEGNYVLHSLDNVEKVTDARPRNVADVGGDELFSLE